MTRSALKSSRISAKLALALVVLGLFYCASLTVIYFYLQMPQVEKDVNENIHRILDTLQQPATQSVFHLDEESAQTALKGIAHYPFFEKVTIRSDTDEVLADVEFAHHSLKYPDFFYWIFKFPETSRYERMLADERFEDGVSGKLIAHVNLFRAHDVMIEKLYAVMGAIVLQVFVFVIIVYFIVHRLIANRLVAVNSVLSAISPESPKGQRVPTFTSNDEIDGLAVSLNAFIDATERHVADKNQAEKGLLHLTQHLEVVIRERTADLEKALDKAEQSRDDADKANRAKSIFLSNMSHELRTPLNSIIGFTNRIIKKSQSNFSEREKDALERVHDNGQYLLNMVNDLLDIAKIEAEKMELCYDDVQIEVLIADCMRRLSGLAEAKSLHLVNEVSESIIIEADKTRLQQVFMNVISNGIKYTKTGEIRVISKGIEDGILCISIIDTGIGIKEDDFEKVFDPYNHIHSDLNETVSIESTGLGLPLAYKLVGMHGGDIKLESELGKGSAFCIMLPVKRPIIHDDKPLDTDHLKDAAC